MAVNKKSNLLECIFISKKSLDISLNLTSQIKQLSLTHFVLIVMEPNLEARSFYSEYRGILLSFETLFISLGVQGSTETLWTSWNAPGPWSCFPDSRTSRTSNKAVLEIHRDLSKKVFNVFVFGYFCQSTICSKTSAVLQTRNLVKNTT